MNKISLKIKTLRIKIRLKLKGALYKTLFLPLRTNKTTLGTLRTYPISSSLEQGNVTASAPVLQLSNIGKTFVQGQQNLTILKDLNFTINKGQTVALLGPSGAGKSTLLNIAGLLEHQDTGDVFLGGHNTTLLSDDDRTLIRRNYIGFVYQSHHLLPEFSALENVIIPQLIAGESRAKATARAKWLLEAMKLGHRLNHRPPQLSGGEQQRVAIARSLANCPHILLADEPTGNLDVSTAGIVLDLLLDIIKKTGLSAFIATHNPELANKMDRQVTLKNGQIIPLFRKSILS